jgi:sec-independent protein translocase protein TatC
VHDRMCIEEMPFIIQNTEMEGQVFIYMDMYNGWIYSSFSLYFMGIWKFISPALYEKEKKMQSIHIISSLFFLSGFIWLLFNCAFIVQLFWHIFNK